MKIKEKNSKKYLIFDFGNNQILDFSKGFQFKTNHKFIEHIKSLGGMYKKMLHDSIDTTTTIKIFPVMKSPLQSLIVITLIDSRDIASYKLTNGLLFLDVFLNIAKKESCIISEFDALSESKNILYKPLGLEDFQPQSSNGTTIMLPNNSELLFDVPTQIKIENIKILPKNEMGYNPQLFQADHIEILIKSDYISNFIGEMKYIKNGKYITTLDAEIASFEHPDLTPDPINDEPYSSLLTYFNLINLIKFNKKEKIWHL